MEQDDLEILDLLDIEPITLSELNLKDLTKQVTQTDSLYTKEKVILEQLKLAYPSDKLNINVINKLSKKASNIVKLIELSENNSFDLSSRVNNPFNFNLKNNINGNLSYITLSKPNNYVDDDGNMNKNNYVNVKDNNLELILDTIIENNDLIERDRKNSTSEIKWRENQIFLNNNNKSHHDNLDNLEDIKLSYKTIDNVIDRKVKHISIDLDNNVIYSKTLNNRLANGNLTYLTNNYDKVSVDYIKNKNKVQICNGTSKNDRAFTSYTEDSESDTMNIFNKPMSKPPLENILVNGDRINIVGLSFVNEVPIFINNSIANIKICEEDSKLYFGNEIRNNNISSKNSKNKEQTLHNWEEVIDNNNYIKLFGNVESLTEIDDSEYESYINNCLPDLDKINFNNICSIKDLNKILKHYGISDKNINNELRKKLICLLSRT